MKNNQPVTQREYPLKEGVAIISKTDAKGRITWVNEDFIESSGFEEAELLGKAHNIVRHPDMPEAAFRDLWATIQAGRPWSGLVKNRRKDGDHYWVRASVTPQCDGGYMSVRQRPSLAETQAAEALYREMREGRSAFRLQEGQIVRPGLPGKFKRWMANTSIRWRMWATAALGILILAGVGTKTYWMAQSGQVDVTLILGLVLGGSLAFVAMAAWLSHSILTPLSQVTAAARDMARGDLTRALPAATRDEVGALVTELTRTRDNLFEIVYSIRQNARGVADAAGELTQSARQTAEAAQAQSASASNMAATVEEMSVSIDQVGEHADTAQRIALDSGESSRRGGAVVHQAAGEMERIAEAVSSSASAIQELEAYSGEISTIVNVIRDIADQTNLLALNAAIEAARAGEQGRGFAVVADEVRKLAERTANSTSQIGEMITRIQEGAQRATAEMQASVERVGGGVQSAHAAGDSIAHIQDGAASVGRAIDDIALALKEQGAAMQDIARGVEQIAQRSETNSAAAGQTSAAAGQLAGMAQSLMRDAARFKV
jgi:aerotaxis receptor